MTAIFAQLQACHQRVQNQVESVVILIFAYKLVTQAN